MTKKRNSGIALAGALVASLMLSGVLPASVTAPKVWAQVAESGPSSGPIDAGPKVGDAAPDFALPDLTGRVHPLSSFRGGPIVLGFFCGCDRCHAAATKIAALQRQGRMKPFVAVLALDAAGARQFQQATGLTGTLLIDPSDRTAQRYQSDFCPRLWGITSDGHVGYRSNIALEHAELTKALKSATAFVGKTLH